MVCSLDPVLFEHRLGLYELVDFGVLESVLVHELTGVLSADRGWPPDAARGGREVDGLTEVFEAAELGMLLVHDELLRVHFRVVVDTPPEVVVAQLAWNVACVEGGEYFGTRSGAEPRLEVRGVECLDGDARGRGEG